MVIAVIDPAPDPVNITEVITNMIIIAGGVASLYFGIKRWVKKVALGTEKTMEQLDTGNGTTIGKMSARTHELASAANAKADRNYELFIAVSERLDAHMERGYHHEH